MTRPALCLSACLLLASASCTGLATPPIDVPVPAARVIQNAMGVFRQHHIPMLEMSTDAGIRSYLVSGPFDPRDVWTPGEINARIACAGLREVRADSADVLALDVRVLATEWSNRNTQDVRDNPTSVRIGRSRVSLESSGGLRTAEKQHRCTLTREYALELVSAITGQPIGRITAAPGHE